MPPPSMNLEYITNPYVDGAQLATARYKYRTININLKITGTSLTDLQTNVRAIQRMLSDAKERILLGYGTKYYLEVQWGDTANQSTFFDIYRGDLILPDNWWSIYWYSKYTIMRTTLTLDCKPFGRYANQDYTQQTLENEQYTTSLNYFDVTTTEAYGDVPARLYLKIAQSGATGSKKIWIAKRSGIRYNDVLWRQGEVPTSTTNIVGGAHTRVFADVKHNAL